MAFLEKGVTIGVTERGYIFGKKGLHFGDFGVQKERGCKYGFPRIGGVFCVNRPPSIYHHFFRHTLLYIGRKWRF